MAGNTNVVFSNCMFRYFGEPYATMGFLGNATYSNCDMPVNKVMSVGSIVLTPQSVNSYGVKPTIQIRKSN